jgi:lysophospholipase L1-like esterase
MRRLSIALLVSLLCVLEVSLPIQARSMSGIGTSCQTYLPWASPDISLHIAILGDSLSQGWGTTDPYSCGYVNQLPNRMPIAIRSQVSINVATVAQGGQRTDQMAPYALQLLTTHPDISIIELGSNDLRQATPITDFTQYYSQIVQEFLQSRGTLFSSSSLVCLSVWPSPEYDAPAQYAPYNQVISRLCTNVGGFYIDITMLYDLHRTTDFDQSNNWHPNNLGALQIDDTIISTLIGNRVLNAWCPTTASCPLDSEQPVPLVSPPGLSYRRGH